MAANSVQVSARSGCQGACLTAVQSDMYTASGLSAFPHCKQQSLRRCNVEQLPCIVPFQSWTLDCSASRRGPRLAQRGGVGCAGPCAGPGARAQRQGHHPAAGRLQVLIQR